MATTFDHLKQFLDEAELNYQAHEEHNAIAIGFAEEPDETSFRDSDGDAHVLVVVRLAERGELCATFVPNAWPLADCPHLAAVCEAATRLQSKVKLLRFDLTDEDFLQPNVEVSLEESPMCADQLHRAIAGLLFAVRYLDPVIRHAMNTGEVNLDLIKENKPTTETMETTEPTEPNSEPPSGPSSGPRSDILRILELSEAAGGLDALERLLGGGDAPSIEA